MSDNKASFPKTMKAVGFYDGGAADVYKLYDSVPVVAPGPRDLLVRVLSIATNPVDTKVRKGAKKDVAGDVKAGEPKPLKIVGWDAVGIVAATGAEAKNFKVGDRVFFAGVINRPGSYAEFVNVDERLVALAPTKLANDDAATVPLVAITAVEAINEQARIPFAVNAKGEVLAEEAKQNGAKSILVIAGAGGVGSLALQLAKRVFKFGTVIATTSRKETDEWVKVHGADHTINHKNPLLPQLSALGFPKGVDVVFNCAESSGNLGEAVSAVAPHGTVVCITHPGPAPHNHDIGVLFNKRATLTFEFMFERGIAGGDNQSRQSKHLSFVSALFDAGVLKTTLTTRFDFNAENIIAANKLQESGTAIGKIALTVAKN